MAASGRRHLVAIRKTWGHGHVYGEAGKETTAAVDRSLEARSSRR